MSRDFRKELAIAAESRDIPGLLAIAYQLLGRVEADDERRTRQAEKKRIQRDLRVSGTSGMSPDVPGRPGTNRDVPDATHTLRTTRTNTHTPGPAAQVVAKLGDAELQRSLDLLRALFADTQWHDVSGFFLRRKYTAWKAWADIILRDLGPGSQFTPADFAAVCRDEPTLDKKIGSAGILRTFLGYARRERMGERSPPADAARTGSTSRRVTKASTGPAAPPSDPDTPLRWT